jgi:hypothetical protein
MFVKTLTNAAAHCGLNIFATSRFIPDIAEEFSNATSLEIRASEGDVRKYVDGKILQLQQQLPKRVRSDPGLQEEIKTGVVKAADGMYVAPVIFPDTRYANLVRFLLAQLHVASLAGLMTVKELRTALTELPTGSKAYDRAYNDAMKRIEVQGTHRNETAMRVLSWITCAKRPLKTIELRHALAVEVGEPELDNENIPEIEDMVSVCVGLVTVDEESDIVRLVHYTTQEYFERTQDQWFPTAERDITTACVTYLSFSVFDSGYCQTNDEFKERLQSNPLYNYAAKNWGYHTRRIGALNQMVIDFLTRNTSIEASAQALLAETSTGLTKCWKKPPTQTTGLHLAAYFGANNVVQFLLDKQDPNVKDSNQRTPLLWAAQYGYEVIIKLLLEKGADLESKDNDGQTPLSSAAQYGHEAVIKLLLKKGANLETKDNDARPR